MAGKQAREFFLSLALNHGVLPELQLATGKDRSVSTEQKALSTSRGLSARGDRATTEEVVDDLAQLKRSDIIYSAASPDEGSLVSAAAYFGFFFVKRETDALFVRCDGDKVTKFSLLHTLDFTSKRKRSSVIVRLQNGTIMLYSKGADNVMLERLAKDDDAVDPEVLENTSADVDRMAKEGLRTLIVCSRVIMPEEYEPWAKRYREAEVSMSDRKARLESLADEVEQGLSLLGATAIEDSLQQDVGPTIQACRDGGVKVWMLTGDKVNTAEEIGYACALWTGSASKNLVRICASDGSMKMDDKEGGRPERAATIAAIASALEAVKKQAVHGEQCLVLDTGSIWAMLDYNLMPKMLEVARECTSVICARVSPDQKKQVVDAVRRSDPSLVTLSIGDGANDVPMIQTAHIGVGIFGEEGLQAVNNSDFAIGQFRYLRRLLFVHGRWNNMRVS